MVNINVTIFQNNLFDLLEQTIRYNEVVNISTKDGNAILMSEEDYLELMEAHSFQSIPGLKKKLIEGLETPLDGCVPESEVYW